MTKRLAPASVNNKKEVKEPKLLVGTGIKAFFAVKETSSSVQKASQSHEMVGPCSEESSAAISNSEERKINSGDIGHSTELVTPNVAIETGVADELNVSKYSSNEVIETSIIHIIADDAVMPTGKNKLPFFPLFGPVLKNQPQNTITKDTDLNQRGRSLKLNSSALNDSQVSIDNFPTESGIKNTPSTRKKSQSRSNKRKISESKFSKEDLNIHAQEQGVSSPNAIIDLNDSTHQVHNDKTVIINEIVEAAELLVDEGVHTDSIAMPTSVADSMLSNEGLSGGIVPASDEDHLRGDAAGRRISARLQQRQQIQPPSMEESEDERNDRKSRKQRRVANTRKTTSTSEVISVGSSSSSGGGRVRQAKKKASSVILSDGTDISSESSDSVSGRRVKRGGKGQTTAKSVEKKNPFFLSKAQKDLLAAQEREQRIQESIARTAAENNKLFAASVDKNRKTAVLFLPQAPSSSATHQGAAVSDVGDGTQRSSTQGDAFDAFQDLSMCAMMSHVGMTAPLSAIRESLESLRGSEQHPLLRWPTPDSTPVPPLLPPSEKDAAIILDDDTVAWHGMECRDHRRGDDLSSLPLSLQCNYWPAQMNLRFMWTLYCESLSPPVETVVDLTSSAEPATASHKTSPRHDQPDLIEETTIVRWLEYWNAKRRTQRTNSSHARHESSCPDSDGDESVVVLTRRRQKSETPKKTMKRNGHRGRRRKSSYDDDDDDEEEDVCDDDDDVEEDQDYYFSASDSMPRSGSSSARGRNIVTDEKAPSPIDSLSIVLIIQGPVSSGKTTLVHSTASRMGSNVIEINCSQVRNAAAIKKLFSEAAHSHTIAPATTQAVVSSSEGGITTVDLNTSTGESGGSIILFDEVDIIFDEDSSLYNSILQLAKVSKCPIVLTSESAAISSRFKQLYPEVIQLQRRHSNVAARYLTSDEAGATAFKRDDELVTLAAMLTDGDTRAVALQMQLWSPTHWTVEPARKSFTQLLVDNNIDFACFDSLLSALSNRSAVCSEPVPRMEEPSTSEETVCLLAPAVSRVEPRSVVLVQSSEHATKSDDTVAQLNAQLSRSIRIRGRGFAYSQERIASVLASFPDSTHEVAISDDLAVKVEVLADEQQCESVTVLSDSVITAVLPATITTGVCSIVVRTIFSSTSWTVPIRSDLLSSMSDCSWVTVKYSPFGNITAPGTSSASKRKPPLGSGSRRKPGRKKAKLSRGRPKAALSTSSDDADADADEEEEELNDSRVSESDEPIVSQLNNSVDNIHALVRSEGESDNLSDIRRGNKRLLRMHSKNCGSSNQNEPPDAVYGVAMGGIGSTMDDNEVDTVDTEVESDNDKPVAANAVASPVRVASRRRIIESDSEDDVATEIATQLVAEDQVLTATDVVDDDDVHPPASCTNLPTLMRTISDRFTHHMSTVLEIIGDPSLHGINRGLVNIAVDLSAQQEVGAESSSLDLETVKQSLLEYLYTAEHAVGDEMLTLFDPTSFVTDMYSIIHKSTIPGAAFVLTHVLNGALLKALEDSFALPADTVTAGDLCRCDTEEAIGEGGERSVQVSILVRDSVVASFALRYPLSEEDPALAQDISALCNSGKMGLDSLRQLLMASKTFAGVVNVDTSFTFESQTDDVMNETVSFDDLDDSSSPSPNHQMVRFLFSRPKQPASLSEVARSSGSSSSSGSAVSEGSMEGICSALDFLCDSDVLLSAAQRLQGYHHSAYCYNAVDSAEEDGESSSDLVSDDPSSSLDGQRLGHEASVLRRYTAARLDPAHYGLQYYNTSRYSVRQFVTPPEKLKDDAGELLVVVVATAAATDADADAVKDKEGDTLSCTIVASPFMACELQTTHFTRAVTGFLSSLLSHCSVSPCSTLLSHAAVRGLETGDYRVALPAHLAVEIVPMLQLLCRCEAKARADELARQARERQLSEGEVSPRDYGRGMRVASTRRRSYLLLEGKLAPREPHPLKQFQYMSLVTGFDDVQLDTFCKLSLFSL